MAYVIIFITITLGIIEFGSFQNPVTPGTVTPFLNQSSLGVYRFRGAFKKEYHSYWYQDNLNQRLSLGIGERGIDLQAHFWFFRDVAYELIPKEDGNPGYVCHKFIDFNYTMEIEGYDQRYLQTIGIYEVKEKNETFTAEFFLGVALDGVGPLNVLALVDQRDGTYAKLYTTQKIGFAAYSEYYLYPRNDSLPGAEHFVLPAECLVDDIKVVEFFKMFNMQGERIDEECSDGIRIQPMAIPLVFILVWFVNKIQVMV